MNNFDGGIKTDKMIILNYFLQSLLDSTRTSNKLLICHMDTRFKFTVVLLFHRPLPLSGEQRYKKKPSMPSEISGKTCTSLECVSWQPEHIWDSQFVARMKEALKEKVGYLQRFSFPRHLNTAIKWWPWKTPAHPTVGLSQLSSADLPVLTLWVAAGSQALPGTALCGNGSPAAF